MASPFERSASQLLSQLSSSTKPKRIMMSDTAKTDSFDYRLSTYEMFNWFGKPADVSPRVCARYGWICVEKDLLQCVSCKQYLSGHLPQSSNIRLYQNCVDQLKSSIIESHDNVCIWKANPETENHLLPNVFDRPESIAAILSRFQSIQSIDFRPLRLSDCSDQIDSLELQTIAAELRTDIAWQSPALLFAICGWQRGSIEHTLFCYGCRRTIGLWMYSTENSESDMPSFIRDSRKRRSADMCPQSLHPLKQHEYWCIWMNPINEASSFRLSIDKESTEMLPRWKVALNVICAREKPKIESAMHDFVQAKQLLDDTIAIIEVSEQFSQ